ncbi:MAG: adenylyltransferase/cytidyltransferase family protein [Lachnospiraceae bacterium]|nr:adenylyltransferase/cytidyltransferase family protein [Lachnospiraceae bacterium]
MIKVITYGTYDLLHYGHIRLLERAKALGDYLIVGVTADDFDKVRGKINVQQSLMERVDAVRATGIADEIIIEEYEGQKIDDIKRYDIDIFTVGSDWIGQFDYLNEYCKVVYLERTMGVSSSDIREARRSMSLGLVGDAAFLNKVASECGYVNGIHVAGICTESIELMDESIQSLPVITSDYQELLKTVDAVYLRSQPAEHYRQIRLALENGRHVLCESPMTLSTDEYDELRQLAAEKGLILMEAIKTAYATAYSRLLLLLKGGKIGDIVSVDATCTSISQIDTEDPADVKRKWNGIHEWGPTALLPIFHLLGTEYTEKRMVVRYQDEQKRHDSFVKIDFEYPSAVASIKVGNGVKSEGELIISGTNGYVYVPAPWWKTDYFEIRYEDQGQNKRYFYQLDGEGIRYELVAFARAAEKGKDVTANIGNDITRAIVGVMEDFIRKQKVVLK